MLQKALDSSTPTLRDLAAQAKVSYHAMRQYRLGARTPSAVTLRRLARVLRRQAKGLERHAAALEKLAKL